MTDPLIGRTLGHYRLTERLGEGGMGLVYRAHDERLDCDVAVKLLPPEAVSDPSARTLLLREARNAAALKHPNICTIHTVAEAEGHVFIAMEYVEGTPLAERIGSGGMPVASVLRYGAQIADALAHAHERGIVHRDLKSANVMITPEGRVKVLDFGVARRVAPEDHPGTVPIRSTITEAGGVAGTLPYMAPEVLTGGPADRRSDLWSLGVLLFEMASGQLPFAGQTAYELTAKIINDPPPALPARVPAGLRAVIPRCLAKEPSERYQRAGEVRSALEMLVTTRDAIPALPASMVARRWPKVVLVLGAAVATATLIWIVASHIPARAPTLTQLTSGNGAVGAARFAPDGRTVLYTADWDGKPYGLYSARPGSAEPHPLGFDNTWLLAISPTEEMAVLRDPLVCPGPYGIGTLALTSLDGGSPRNKLEHAEWADWSPDGKGLAIVRADLGGKFVLEYPIGNPLYTTAGWITHPRVSRKGDVVAFIEHPLESVLGGEIVVVDLEKRRRTLTEGWKNLWGLAWSPNGREIWFTGRKLGGPRSLHAVSLTGRTRRVHEESSDFILMDVHPDGRALLVRQTDRAQIVGIFPGDPKAREVPGLDYPLSVSLSADGSTLLVQEVGVGGEGLKGSMYLLRTGESQKVPLGEGEALALSPDGQWVLAKMPGPEPAPIALVPTGPGEPRPIPRDSITRGAASWFPDGERFVFAGSEPGRGVRTYVQSVHGEAPRPITPEGIASTVLSPDGRWIAVPGTDTLYSTVGEPPRVVPDLTDAGIPLAWAADGKSLFVEYREVTVHTIYRFDLATGEREQWMELVPPEEAGVVNMYNTLLTPDGKYYAFTYERNLSDLFLFEGLR
jgi:Tol biopolymer transport system component